MDFVEDQVLMNFLENAASKAAEEIKTKGTLSTDNAIPLILKSQFNHIIHLDMEITGIKEGMTIMNQRMLSLEGSMVAMKGDMVAMKGDMVAMKGDMVAMKGDMVAMSRKMITKSDFSIGLAIIMALFAFFTTILPMLLNSK